MTKLKNHGWQVLKNDDIAGIGIDLIARNGEGPWLGIDLIGYPGATAEQVSYANTRILNRTGFSLFPLSYAEWHIDPSRCLVSLEKSAAENIDLNL